MRVRSGNASVRLALSCPAAEAGGCKGTVALTSAKSIKIGSQRVRVVLAAKSYSLKAGEKKTVRSSSASQGAAQAGQERPAGRPAQTITRDAAGNVATGSRSMTLSVPKK